MLLKSSMGSYPLSIQILSVKLVVKYTLRSMGVLFVFNSNIANIRWREIDERNYCQQIYSKLFHAEAFFTRKEINISNTWGGGSSLKKVSFYHGQFLQRYSQGEFFGSGQSMFRRSDLFCYDYQVGNGFHSHTHKGSNMCENGGP